MALVARAGGVGWGWALVLALAVAGCGDGARVIPEHPALEFGLVPLYQTVERQLVVTNPGEAPLTLRPRLDGSGGDAFSVLPASLVVEAGATGRVRVAFRPRAGGTAGITLRLEVEGGATAAVGLSGEGLDPRGFVARSSLNFGVVAPGTSTLRRLALSNPTSRPVRLSLTVPAGVPLSAEPPEAALEPGAAREIDLVYAPPSAARHAGELEVHWDDAHPPLTVAFVGEARPPRPVVWSHDLVDFGAVPPGREASAELTVTNATAGLVEVRTWLSAAASDGEPDPAFEADTGVLALKGGVSGKVIVRFAPEDEVSHQANLRWSTDLPGRPEGGIHLGGDGRAPWVVLPSELAFGRVGVGAYVDGELVITNRGSETAVVALPGPVGAFTTTPSEGTVTLAPGEVRGVPLRFAPTRAGPHVETLSLETNDPFQPSAQVSLTGEAVDVGPCDAVLPGTVDLGHASIGRAASGALRLAVPETAAGPCLVSRVELTGRDGALFSAPGFPLEGTLVEPGAALDIALAFTPTRGVDPAEATAALYVGDPTAPVRTVALTGWAGVEGLSPDADAFRFSTWASTSDSCPLPLCWSVAEDAPAPPLRPVHTHPDVGVTATWGAATPLVGERCLLARRSGVVAPRLADLWLDTPGGRSDPVRLDLGEDLPDDDWLTGQVRFAVADRPRVDVLVVMDDSLTDEGWWRVWDDLADDLLPPAVQTTLDFRLGVVAGTLTGTDAHTPGVLLPEPPSDRPRVISPALADPVDALFEHLRDGRPVDEAPWMLEAMRMALSPRRTGAGGVNEGLLRPGVPLGLIFLSGSGDDRVHHEASVLDGLIRRLGREGHPLQGLALVASPDAGAACDQDPLVTGALADFVRRHRGTIVARCPGTALDAAVEEVFGPGGRGEFPLPERAAAAYVSVVGADGVARSATGWEPVVAEGSHDVVGVRFLPGSAPAPGETVVVDYRRLSTDCTDG